MKFSVPLIHGLSDRPKLLGRLALAGGTLILGQWALSDLLHIPGGGFSLLLAGAGVWWFSRSSSPPRFQSPQTLQAWIQRCRDVLDQFENFEGQPTDASGLRRRSLQSVIDRSGPQQLGLVCLDRSALPEFQQLQAALAGSAPLTLSMANPLVLVNGQRCWPEGLRQQDLILYGLRAPLMAADLLWLHQVPEDQPAWLIVNGLSLDDADQFLDQLPQRWRERVLRSDVKSNLRLACKPLRQALNASSETLERTQQRLLADLHRGWQADLEGLRRVRFQSLQQRTQWVVAGAVLASPMLSVDLLAVAVANGLMLREMGEIWGTELNPDVLKEAAGQLARAALAQGVVEWTSQALLGLAKLDGGSWLAAGAMQALSAAYLTRVVGRSMADWLALNAGVTEPDLASLKRDAPLLVARAAQEERLDWSGFIQQSRQWLTT